MKISEICIRRPVLAWVFTLVLLLVGLVAFSRLPVQKLPNIENVYLTIETSMPGVGPDIVESQITRHIEDAISGIEGVETISSVSSSEESKVLIEFRPGRSMDNAVNDVRDRLYRAKEKLPQANLRTEPMIIRSRSDERPIIILALTSESTPPSELYDYAENEIKKELESINGVARVDVSGSSALTMKVGIDPQKMAAHKINVSDIREAIENQNFESPAGTIENKNRRYNLTTVADLRTPEDFNNVIVKTEKGRIIRVRDVGKAHIQTDDKKTRTRFNGKQGVQISISKQSNANPLQVTKDIRLKLEEMRTRLPKEIQVDVASDSTKFIKKSINNVYWSIIEASVLVVLVVFLFLKSARASLIPLITIPVSIIGVAFFMYIFNFTLNLFTLFAMVLAVGLVVDDAIVVLENIHRHVQKGLNSFQAAFKGIREVGFSIIAMTFTLVAVYLPIPLGSGKLAKFFTEFAITLAGSVLLSGFVALTLSPMMCARLLKNEHSKDPIPEINSKTLSFWAALLFKWQIIWERFKQKTNTEGLLSRIEERYEHVLHQSLQKRSYVLKIAVFVSLIGGWVFSLMRNEYIPYEDTRSIRIEGHAPASAPLEYTEKHLNTIDQILQKYPEIERRISSIVNPQVDISVELTDESSSLFKKIIDFFKPHRKTTQEIIDELKVKFRSVTGFDPRIRSSSSGGDANVVEFVIRGNRDRATLSNYARQMTYEIYKSNVIGEIRTASSAENQDYVITLKREKIANIKKTPREVANHIRYLLKNERTGTRFKKDNKQYDITLEVFSKYKESPDDVLNLFIRAGNTYKENALVPLSELIEIESRTTPHEINRYNRTRSYSVVGILKPGHTTGEGIKIVSQSAKNILPEGVHLEFIGETRDYIKEQRSMYLVFFLALCFIYLILAAQFESWRDPFIIFFTVPFSLIGGVLFLAQLDTGTFNMFSFIGFVTLIGLITKHGILIVDFTNRLRLHETLSIQDAVIKACKIRLRPILMTTFAMVLGAVPLMFGGAGNESRRQLGAVIIGGMSIGTIFTLFVVPVIYTYLTDKNRLKKTIQQPDPD